MQFFKKRSNYNLGRFNFSSEIGSDAFGLRVAFLYIGIFSVFGVQVPYLPLWLEGRGLTIHQVGYVIALPFLLRLFFTPYYALVADRLRLHRTFIIMLALSGVASIIGLINSYSFISLLILCSLFSVATSSIIPLAETVAVMGSHGYGLDYGRIRLWGSLSFAFFGLIGGYLIEKFGSHTETFLLITTAFITFITAYFLPSDNSIEKGQLNLSNVSSKKIFTSEFRNLIQSKVFNLFLVAVSAIQGSHALFYTFGILHFQKLGLSGFWIGFNWALGVMSEVLFFAFSSRILGKVSPLFLISLGGIAAVIRWSIMSADPPLIFIFFLQLLHAFTFGATHLGAIRFIAEVISPEIGATAQALHSSFAVGIVMGLSTAFSGYFYAAYSGKAFLFMSALASVSLLATVLIYFKWDGQKL